MKIFIVDDDDIKIKKIETLISETLQTYHHEILVAKNIADAMQILLNQSSIDLLVLDLNIPTRQGSEIKKLAGLTLLNEIVRRQKVCKPEAIIGLTAYKEEEIKSHSSFRNEGWAIVHFDASTDSWEHSIRNKITYLLGKNQYIETAQSSKSTILFVASSPVDQNTLNAGLEQRKIEDVLSSSTLRDSYNLVSKTGAKLETLTKEMMILTPRFVHFTGHGDSNGIVMEDDNGSTYFVPSDALIQLFEIFKNDVHCVLISACYSFQQAKSISTQGIYVIGMNDEVGVETAIEFSKGFYQAIGEGKNVIDSFKFGLVHLTARDISQKNVPEIWFNGVKIN